MQVGRDVNDWTLVCLGINESSSWKAAKETEKEQPVEAK